MMHSKWLDFATEVAAFHYQSYRYNDMKPPSFGAHPQIQSALLRDTDIVLTMTEQESSTVGAFMNAAVDDATAPGAVTNASYNSSSSIIHQIPPSIAEDKPVLLDFHGDKCNNNNSINTGTIQTAPTTTDYPNQNHDDSADNILMPSLNRQISVRARERRRQKHNRHSTMEDLIQQLDAHEKTERERQEQFDAMQREEEDRIMFEAQQEHERKLLQEQQLMENTSPLHATNTPTITTPQYTRESPSKENQQKHQLQQLLSSQQYLDSEPTGDATAYTEVTSMKGMSPLKGIKQRFKTFRRQRHQPQDNIYANMNAHGVVPSNPVTAKKKGKRRERASRFASSFFRMSNNKKAVPTTTTTTSISTSPTSKSINRPKQLLPNNYHHDILFQDRFDTTTGKPYSVFTAVTRTQLRAGHVDPDQVPPLLFLEEVAHLLSLLSAVAFSTLRNDLPYAESPLTLFEPGLPWPHVDPDAYKRKNRRGWEGSKYRWFTLMRFVIGASRTARDRTLYNAARPFRVIGNVSDEEIAQLQQARGPLAKVALVSMWIQELISREYQTNDSTGTIAPPILSRLYQFVSEGMAGYNQARKIASIPFPFAHAQLT
jgi:hypothetical protein